MMKVMVSARTYRALVAAGEEHRLDVDQMATLCVAAAVAAWKGGERGTIPREDPGDLGEAVVMIRMNELVHAIVAGRAEGAALLVETQLRLILDVAVRDYIVLAERPARPPLVPFKPRRWRAIEDLVAALRPRPSAAEITAAVLGDPSHRASVQVTRAGRQVDGDNFV